MTPEILETLSSLVGGVVTAVETTPHRARISVAGESASASIILTACEWADERCETCRCSKDRVRVEVE